MIQTEKGSQSCAIYLRVVSDWVTACLQEISIFLELGACLNNEY
ncbi:hypothetical protein HAT2_00693 [Candidatus Similichlamydia laticola]|uniref:Uncharacterized protein n=1 Tax=Candidatus Similichlamydia laticola TaxID=2170265 RepID=A0A369KHD9_9BACT|nr:hypothetical protein HAT2_00693 [Candidatus Similichlamydia laticola]